MKRILPVIVTFALLGCNSEDKMIVLCKGEAPKTTVHISGETIERFDCIDTPNKTRCSAAITKDRIFIGCGDLETENAKILCMSLKANISDTGNTVYSCTLNSGLYTTKCAYKINDDNTGEIICTKDRTLFEIAHLFN